MKHLLHLALALSLVTGALALLTGFPAETVSATGEGHSTLVADRADSTDQSKDRDEDLFKRMREGAYLGGPCTFGSGYNCYCNYEPDPSFCASSVAQCYSLCGHLAVDD